MEKVQSEIKQRTEDFPLSPVKWSKREKKRLQRKGKQGSPPKIQNSKKIQLKFARILQNKDGTYTIKNRYRLAEFQYKIDWLTKHRRAVEIKSGI
jgi:hypothetical protein